MATRHRKDTFTPDADFDLDLWRSLDLFPTPPWATRTLFEVIFPAINYPPISNALEPAAGLGHMSTVIGEYVPRVVASDVHPYGDHLTEQRNFITHPPEHSPQWIITNPPFILAEEFLSTALKVATSGIAFLLRLSWLEGAERYNSIWNRTPASLIAPFSERVSMSLGGWDPKAQHATAHAWFIWFRNQETGAWHRHDRYTAPMMLIPPGQKRALTRAEDINLARRHVPGWSPDVFTRPPGTDPAPPVLDIDATTDQQFSLALT